MYCGKENIEFSTVITAQSQLLAKNRFYSDICKNSLSVSTPNGTDTQSNKKP
jgi:hypothetical protein